MADRKLIPSISALALLLAGCAVGPDYHEPEAAVPQQFVSAEASRYTAQATDLATFWTSFGDATLDRLEAIANIGEGALNDDAHRVVEIRATHFRVNIDGPDVSDFHESRPPSQGLERSTSNQTSIPVLAYGRRNGRCACPTRT